jgi:iron uptake system EfeUOB component EfeO/EfeM
MNTKHFEEANFEDSPYYTNEESHAWASGYDKALENTNAKGILEALEQLLASYKLYVKNPEKSEFVTNAETAIKKATT